MDNIALIKQYISTGQAIPEPQFAQLNTNQLKTYFYFRNVAAKANEVYSFTEYEIASKIGAETFIKYTVPVMDKTDYANQKETEYTYAISVRPNSNKYSYYNHVTDFLYIFKNGELLIKKKITENTIPRLVNVDIIKNTDDFLNVRISFNEYSYALQLSTKKLTQYDTKWHIYEYNKYHNSFLVSYNEEGNYDGKRRYFMCDTNFNKITPEYDRISAMTNGYLIVGAKDKENILSQDLKPIFKKPATQIYQPYGMKGNPKTDDLYIVYFDDKHYKGNVFDTKTGGFLLKSHKANIVIQSDKITWSNEQSLEE